MKTNFNIFKTINYSVLSESDITQIHYATLDILKNVGNRIFSEEALELLKKAGCKVEGNIVKVPPHLVEKALLTVPKQVTIFNRDGKKAMEVEGEAVFFGTGPTTPFTLDIYTGERRLTTTKDIELHAKVADSLPNIDFVMPLGSVSNVPKDKSDLYEFAETIKFTKKPIPFVVWNRENLKTIVEIASIFSGGQDGLIEKPFIISFPEPISPLTHPREAVEVLLYSAEIGLPAAYYTDPTLGANGPLDIYGSVIQGNAECLMGLVMSQLKREGAVYIMGAAIAPLNMSNGLINYGSPEFLLANSAYTKVCQYYGIPTWDTGGSTDSNSIDEQAALESALCTFMAAISGNNFIHDLGYMERCLTGSAEMLVMQEEIVGFVKRIIEGVDSSNDREVRSLISQCGPGGHYLNTDHTYKNFRKLWHPELLNKESYEVWKQNGSISFREKLNKKTKELVESYKQVELDNNVIDEINNIIKKNN